MVDMTVMTLLLIELTFFYWWEKMITNKEGRKQEKPERDKCYSENTMMISSGLAGRSGYLKLTGQGSQHLVSHIYVETYLTSRNQTPQGLEEV